MILHLPQSKSMRSFDMMSEGSQRSKVENRKDADAILKKSSLYQEFLAEREEILRHKWIESEKAGKDIGFERALLDWIRKHRDSWRAARRDGSPSSKSA